MIGSTPDWGWGPIGHGDGHGEGLWVVEWLALPPNGMGGTDQGASGLEEGPWVVGRWFCL